MHKNYIVTGGCGFIGTNLVIELSKKANITIIDNLTSGFEANVSYLKNVKLIKADISDFKFDKFRDRVDGVIHLAAQASVPFSIENFLESSKANILGSINVIDFCSKNSIPLVYASSSAVYGDLDLGNDETNLFDLLSPYSSDKLCMEYYAMMANKTYGLSSIGLRFFNVYGPHQDANNPYSGVISIFTEKLIKNEDIYINGGYQTRDFIYVKDVVYAIIKCLNIASEGIQNEVINLLTGKSTSIDNLFRILTNNINSHSNTYYRPLPKGDAVKSEGTTYKMEKLINKKKESFVNLEEGLFETIKFFMQDG